MTLSKHFKKIIERKPVSTLLDNHILLLYSALLLVENDDSSKLKGYHWKELKESVKKDLDIYNNTAKFKITIPNEISLNTIYFSESNNIAANFLRNLRHAFAHNYIKYDKTNEALLIFLPDRTKQFMKLYANITVENLKKIIEILKKQPSNKTKKNRKSK